MAIERAAEGAAPTRRRGTNVLGPAIGQAASQPPEPARHTAGHATLGRYVGVYTDPWDWRYRVMIRNGELVLYEHDYPPSETVESSLSHLEPVAEHTFRMGDGELVTFEMADDGSVARLRRRYEYLTPVRGTPVRGTDPAAD